MFRYAVLGSGSSANSYIFEYKGFSFLLDNGFSTREVLKRMKTLSFDPGKLEFIFLTHIHNDHLKGVEALSADLSLPVVAHENLPLQSYTEGGIHKVLSVLPGKEYEFRELKFTPFETYHDAPFSLGYHFNLGGTKITVITDTGKYDSVMISFARSSSILFLESNYSENMLDQGKYPPFLKSRIRSERGHLSNFQAGEFLRETTGAECSLEQIFLCHLSKNNNTVETVEMEIGENCSGGIPVRICARGEMVPGIPLQASRSTLVPGGGESSSPSYSETPSR